MMTPPRTCLAAAEGRVDDGKGPSAASSRERVVFPNWKTVKFQKG